MGYFVEISRSLGQNLNPVQFRSRAGQCPVLLQEAQRYNRGRRKSQKEERFQLVLVLVELWQMPLLEQQLLLVYGETRAWKLVLLPSLRWSYR